jgi:hypothetical protein
LRAAVWFSNYGMPTTRFELPYKSQSPTLFKKLDYLCEEDLLDEIYRIIEEANKKKFSLGQSLYHQLPFFCDPQRIISDWCWDMITDYFTIKKYNVPLATSLEEVNPYIIDCFSVIDNELNKISIYEKENGR